MSALARSEPGQRLPVIDMARGAALIAMFGYHLTWDLADFGFIAPQAPFSPGMRLFSHIIASSFLFIAGASLVLARRMPFRWGAYWRRIGVVAAAAAAVSIASWALFPDGLILFGILHCIAVASLLALPFLFLPWPAALGAAVVAASLPFAVASQVFDGPGLIWTGLGTVQPNSNDFRPLLPWAAALLAGVGVMQFALPRGGLAALARVDGASAPARALAFGGRHSLLIYLVHQPIFFAALTTAVWAFGPPSAAPPALDEAPFRAGCERQCLGSGASPGVCVSACGCAARGMKRLNLWDKLARNELDAAEKAILSRLAADCVAHPN